MDSGNSGSMQSSEEEYDPRAAADSSFTTIFNHLSPPPPTIYEPTTNLSTFYNPPLTNPFFTPQPQTLPFPPHNFKQNQTPTPRTEPPRQNHQDQTTQLPRNPKKRSRASRRAPTTVLTTDTTNFRAMVQEFTGIPAPPFSQSSQFPRTRVDLFSTTPSSLRSNVNSLLLRPLPQKVLQFPQPSSNFYNESKNNSTIFSTQYPLHFPNSSELGFSPSPNQNNFFPLGIPSQVTGLPDLISPDNGDDYARNVRNEKQNIYSATNENLQKRTDNVSNAATRGTSQGMMEPWICSSD